MKKKAIALIPFLAARRRRSQRERGAKIGAPALIGIGGAAAAIILRRRKRTAAGYDASPSELGGTQPGATTSTDGSAADAPPRGQGRPSTFEGDPADSVPAAGAAGVGQDAVIPDTSTDDPAVVEAEQAAAADAAAIGGDIPDTPPVEGASGNAFRDSAE